jgi:hypothetical protein
MSSALRGAPKNRTSANRNDAKIGNASIFNPREAKNTLFLNPLMIIVIRNLSHKKTIY